MCLLCGARVPTEILKVILLSIIVLFELGLQDGTFPVEKSMHGGSAGFLFLRGLQRLQRPEVSLTGRLKRG